MNLPVVRLLVAKDLFIHRWPMLGLGVAVPTIALALALRGNPGWQNTGMILMSNTLIWLSFFIPIATISKEQKPFLLSLPISSVEYTASKIFSGLIVFMLPWLVFAFALPKVIERNEQLAAGALVPATVLLMGFLLSFLLSVAATLVFESLTMTLGVGFVAVVAVFAFMPLMAHVPVRILKNWAGSKVVWDSEVLIVLAVEAVLCALAIAATFYLQSRRKSWI